MTATAPALAISEESTNRPAEALTGPMDSDKHGQGNESGSRNGSLQLGRPSENVTGGLSIEYTSSRWFEVNYDISYPARTAAEATKAKNGTLNPHWFNRQGKVKNIFNEVADRNATQDDNFTSSRLVQTDEEHSPTSADHGRIHLEYRTEWRGPPLKGNDLRIGKPYVATLEEGWQLVVIIPFDWEPSVLKGSPEKTPEGPDGILTRYTWTITDDMDTPLLVVEDPSLVTYEEGPLGVAGGAILPLVALLGVFALARIRSA